MNKKKENVYSSFLDRHMGINGWKQNVKFCIYSFNEAHISNHAILFLLLKEGLKIKFTRKMFWNNKYLILTLWWKKFVSKCVLWWLLFMLLSMLFFFLSALYLLHDWVRDCLPINIGLWAQTYEHGWPTFNIYDITKSFIITKNKYCIGKLKT